MVRQLRKKTTPAPASLAPVTLPSITVCQEPSEPGKASSGNAVTNVVATPVLTRQHTGHNITNNADLEANLHRMHNIIHAKRPMTSKNVRLCKTDTEKSRLYAEIRNRLLD